MPDAIDQISALAHIVSSPACHAYNDEAFQISHHRLKNRHRSSSIEESVETCLIKLNQSFYFSNSYPIYIYIYISSTGSGLEKKLYSLDKTQVFSTTVHNWVKLKKIDGGVYNPNAPTKRTCLEFHQQYNIDKHN